MNRERLESLVADSLLEDMGSGDITAQLIAQETQASAKIISRESAMICGIPWFNEVFHQVDDRVQIDWKVKEGEWVEPDACLVGLQGGARSLVTGERCALNWLQCLSGTATQVAHCVKALAGTKAKLLDTRKTIPGLRDAQKYAVKIGGGKNHRMGLYDAFLIKENHITSCGSIKNAVVRARELFPDKPIEMEVENFSELEEVLSIGVDTIMLDNFDLDQMKQAVNMTKARSKLEVSGNVDFDRLRDIAMTGIDFISMGALTKNVRAIDFSMRFGRE